MLSKCIFHSMRIAYWMWVCKREVRDVLHTYLNDVQLSPACRRRLRDYPLQFIVFFAHQMGELRGRELSKIERKRLIYFAAFGSIFDDLFDMRALSDPELKALYRNPCSFEPLSYETKITKSLIEKLYDIYPKRDEYLLTFDIFFDAQIASRRQYKNRMISQNELKEISFRKGGYALLLSRLLLENPASNEEKEAVYTLGGWYQILDDILDIHKDILQEISTLANTTKSIESLEAILIEQELEAFRRIEYLDYPLDRKKNVIEQFKVIGTTGKIQLHYLQNIPKQSSGEIDFWEAADEMIQWRENRFSNFSMALKIWSGLF